MDRLPLSVRCDFTLSQHGRQPPFHDLFFIIPYALRENHYKSIEKMINVPLRGPARCTRAQ